MMEPLNITTEMAAALVRQQFPQWKDEPLMAVGEQGTDNQIFRLGDDKSVRLPRVEWAAKTAAREQALTARFQHLPLDVPRPLGLGGPGFGYPWQWSVAEWIEGGSVGMRQLTFHETEQLAQTIEGIRETPTDKTFSYDRTNYGRGEPLLDRDDAFQVAAVRLADEFEIEALRRIWSDCLKATPAEFRPVFLHGDIHGGNLIERNSKLVALIDWGLAGAGDGACDLSAAWCLCGKENRNAFRNALDVSDVDWLRGAGWALSIACIYIAHYRDRADSDCAMSRRTVQAVLAEFA